jgi:hypothetical protein
MTVARCNNFQVLLTILFIVTSGCARSPDSEGGSNTNWMSCATSTDCQGQASCICGLCTRTCGTDEECSVGDRPGSCVDPVPASDAVGCAAVVRDAKVKICLPDCIDSSDCGKKALCIRNACWPIPDDIIDMRGDSSFVVVRDGEVADSRADAVRDGGKAGSGADASGALYPETDDAAIDAYRPGALTGVDAAVDAAIDFSTPVTLPPPETVIAGSFTRSSLVGVWEEDPGATHFWGGPIQLVIKEDSAEGQGLVGNLTFLCEDKSADVCQQEVTLPPAAEIDPNIGFPPSLDMIDQYMLRMNILPHFDYRIFDGRVDGDRFSFWITNDDPWRDWCAAQTSYPVERNGRIEYYCIPDPKPFDADGVPPDDFSAKEMLCAADNSVCDCNKDNCSISYRGAVNSFDLLINEDIMQGTFITSLDTIPVVLHRIGE